jgi:hypothetical protein
MTEEPIIFTHEPAAESERYEPPSHVPFEVKLYADGHLIAQSTDAKLWARVLVLLLTASDEARER